jgi:steroid Delta-isomerase
MLAEHVQRFNEAVRSGEYGPMLAAFAPDAEMVFEGVPVGPFVGRDAIAAAYAAQPPDDEVVLLGEPRVDGEVEEADYAWESEGTRAGRMILTSRAGEIARLVVTFE